MPSLETLLKTQLQWVGHMLRMEDSRLPKFVIFGQLRAGSRTKGGQCLRYKYIIKHNYLKAAEIPLKQKIWRPWPKTYVHGVVQSARGPRLLTGEEVERAIRDGSASPALVLCGV